MDIAATVDFAFNRVKSWQSSSDTNVSTAANGDGASDNHFTVYWSNSIFSKAAYNRSLDHNTVYVETDAAVDRFRIATTQQGFCYDR